MPARFAILAATLLLCACGDAPVDDNGVGDIALVETQVPARLPKVDGSDDPTRPLIVIDPGHGGRDPGAASASGDAQEKDITLALAKSMRDGLVASGRTRVALTREDDLYLGLTERYEIARRLGADLFLSVHADAAARPEARGATLYTLSEIASDAKAAAFASRENISGGTAAAQAPDASVRHILLDLTQRESMERSADFARLLHREAAATVPFQENYHRFAALAVLRAPEIPSVLLEAGYLTNSEDAAFLASAAGRGRIADAVVRAVEIHAARRRASPKATVGASPRGPHGLGLTQ